MLRTLSTFAILLSALICGCGHDRKPPAAPPPQTGPAPAQYNELAGLKAYRAGLAALAADDLDKAQSLLLDAVHQNKDLAEAWFELGHLKVKLAPGMMQTDELKAMVTFREGLQFVQEARKLIDQDKIAIWTPAEVDQARVKMESDLRDADRALADEESLREALRQRVY
jgi:tetratricopeptide (TPR) repeat protein